MKELTTKFRRLKTSIGGNREQVRYEDTFGMPREEQAHITRPSRWNTRILGELEFAMNLSQERKGKYDPVIENALDYLLSCVGENGVLTNRDCEHAEDLLKELEQASREYQLILAAHSHMDMNWMWGFHETVSLVLATFRTILNIMDEYPDFCFSQSQAAVYKIVEDYDPSLMERIKSRITEGRWEVTASAWVETDKNMPNMESLLRHIQYTKEYLSKTWGVSHFDVDFSPDTFGHNGNVPEINTFGHVKYYYHCRGLDGDYVLYRYRAPSGREVLAYREPNWYNGAITPHIGAGIVELSRRCAGLKTGLVVYGVGDHGGGPTRRDIERAKDMMSWRIYPRIRFGTIREFFREAETVRDQLPVVGHELNYFAPGCYTTQSRIKRGNKRLEAALTDAGNLSVMAGSLAGFAFQRDRLVKAWQDVLFTQFHDILTGSCVQDSREHAMGLYQTSLATANTQLSNAMLAISEQIDTSSVSTDADPYDSQSEGAGAGYGLENLAGASAAERGMGKTRIFHIFNTLPEERREVAELSVWDWTGDLKRIAVAGPNGEAVEYQLLDGELQQYWDHKFFRILVDVGVPAFGYTTVVLSEVESETYPVYFQTRERLSSFYPDRILKNDKITAVLDAKTGRLRSLKSNDGGRERIAGETAGLTYVETEKYTSSAWQIGRHIRSIPVDQCVRLEETARGPLRESVKATYKIADSVIEVVYTLDKYQSGVQADITVDWKEIGGDIVPVLDYRIPVSYPVSGYLYDIPGAVVKRGDLTNDVPALQYGMAAGGGEESVILASDSKYGYRGSGNTLALTLINSSTSPDPYPERGIHSISLLIGMAREDAGAAERMAASFCHKLLYQSSGSHSGCLPMEQSLLKMSSESIVTTAVTAAKDGAVLVRGYNTSGKTARAEMLFAKNIVSTEFVDLEENPVKGVLAVDGRVITMEVDPYSIFEVKIRV